MPQINPEHKLKGEQNPQRKREKTNKNKNPKFKFSKGNRSYQNLQAKFRFCWIPEEKKKERENLEGFNVEWNC